MDGLLVDTIFCYHVELWMHIVDMFKLLLDIFSIFAYGGNKLMNRTGFMAE